jgi:hypothetical protein
MHLDLVDVSSARDWVRLKVQECTTRVANLCVEGGKQKSRGTFREIRD